MSFDTKYKYGTNNTYKENINKYINIYIYIYIMDKT